MKKIVPDILHFVWLGKLDGVQQDYIKTWATVNPGKKIRVWYDPDALLSHELGKKIKDNILSRAQYLIHTEGYINAVLQLQNKAHVFISDALSQGGTFDNAAADFMHQELGIPRLDIALIRQENADSYQNFIQQCDTTQISLADVKTLDHGINKKYYYQELSLRQNLPAASDMVRLGALYQEGGVYFDADLLPRLKELAFAGIQHPDFSGKHKLVLLEFARTQLILEYLHGQGYFHGRQAKVEDGQYNDSVTRYINDDTHGVEARSALVKDLRDAIQRAGQAHLDSGSVASLLTVFFSPLDPISIHLNVMKVGGIMGGYSNAALASHPGSKTLDSAFKKINANYAILDQHDFVRVNSMEELEQHIDTVAGARHEDILDHVRMANYRLDNLTDTRVTIDLTGPNLMGHVAAETLIKTVYADNKGIDAAHSEDIRRTVMFYDFNNATEEEAKSSWANNAPGRFWPFRPLSLPKSIIGQLSEITKTGKKPESEADRALLAVATGFDVFQKASGEKKISALVTLRHCLDRAQEVFGEKKVMALATLRPDLDRTQQLYGLQKRFDLGAALKKMQRRIDNGLFLEIPIKDMEALTGSVKRQPESEQKQALLTVLDHFSAFLSAPEEKSVAALLAMRKQLVDTLTLLPVPDSDRTSQDGVRETLLRMQKKIDRELFSMRSQKISERLLMSAVVKEKIIDISGWSPERAAFVHYSADAALQGALGYNERKVTDLVEREVAARQVFLRELKEYINRFKILVDRLYHGQVAFHEFSIFDQQLISRFLDAGEMAELARRSEDGRVLHQAVGVLVDKSADSVEDMVDVRAALHAVMDAESAAWQNLAQELGISVDVHADHEAGRTVLNGMRQHEGNERVSVDSYTKQALGFRARVIHKLQTFVDRAGKGVLVLSSVAALCRIRVINYRLAHEKLSDAKKAELLTEKGLALAELGADLGDEAIGLIQRSLNIPITRPSADAMKASALSPKSFALNTGSRIMQGIRSYGLTAVGTLLSAVGTGLAWYGVHAAIGELREFRHSEQAATDHKLKAQIQDKIAQLEVNLGVNIVTAIISTGLTVGSTIALAASIVGTASGAAAGVMAFMAAAGPVGGAIMVAAFIGLWIYNGIGTVGEFSKYVKLGAWERFVLGAGSIFGYVPGYLQKQYDFNKIRLILKEAAKQEALAVFDSHCAVKTTHHYLIPEIRENSNPGNSNGLAAQEAQCPLQPVSPISTKMPYAFIDIDMDAKTYTMTLNGETRIFNPKDYIYVRKTRDQVIPTVVKNSLHLINGEELAIETQRNFLREGRPLSSYLPGRLPLSSLLAARHLFILQSMLIAYKNEHDNSVAFYKQGEDGQKAVLLVATAGRGDDNKIYLYRHENHSDPIVVLLDLEGKTGYRYLVIRSENNHVHMIAVPGVTSTRIQAVFSIKLDGDSIDDMLVLLPDRILTLKGGDNGFSLLNTFSEDTAGLLAILRDPTARVFAAREAVYVTLFCTYEEADKNKLTFFKYRKNENGNYQLDACLTQDLPSMLWSNQLKSGAGIFFHDLDGDGLADRVVVGDEGNLQVALQKRDGTFIPTDEFSIYRAQTADGSQESLSFSGHKILGFGGTLRTLYSQDSSGNRYAHTVISRAENKSQVTWVNLNIPVPETKWADVFTASAKFDAGNFIFLLGGGRNKTVTGGVNNDSFYLLDGKTDFRVNGGKGTDTLDFSRLSSDPEISGVRVNARTGEVLVLAKDSAYASLFSRRFSNIENFTGTHGDDELTGDDNDNVLDGVAGKDILDAGAGNDVLRGVNGIFSGGKGSDLYQFRRTAKDTVITVVDLIEDYSLGEDSHVSLDYRIDEIKHVIPQETGNGTHLLITCSDGVQYRLRDFFANQYVTGIGRASAWHIITRDGFRFRLETAEKLPAGMTALSGISVFFQSTLTEEERGQARINLHGIIENRGARVEVIERIAGVEKKSEIQLPALFDLVLRLPGKQGMITGSNRSECLTGGNGGTMKGNAGSDTYVIEDSQGGVVTIDNHDAADIPEQDTLILPWRLSETLLSVEGSHILLSHASQPDNHVKVRLCDFMTRTQSRHLAVRDSLGQLYRLDVTGDTAYLASGELILDKEDRLEVLSASQGGLILDSYLRDLSAGKNKSTVMIDRSARGNELYGTENVRNYLQVTGGDNILRGGNLADVLQGGSGHDDMQGKKGNDAYYVSGSATIEDTAGEDTLILTDTKGTAQEELWLEKTQDNALHIRFRNNSNRKVLIKGYFNSDSDKKVEHIVMNDVRLSGEDIDNLVNAMSSMPPFAERAAVQNSPILIEALGRWSSVVTSSSVALTSMS